MLMEELVSVLTLYDLNGDGVFDFDEFIELVSDLLCLRDGVLLAPPQAGRNLAVVLAKQIPGPARDTIEVADLVELDGRWASLITQPDVVAAGGAGLRSLSDQGLRRDLEDLRARRQAPERAVPVAEAVVALKRGGSWGSSAASSWFYDHPSIRCCAALLCVRMSSTVQIRTGGLSIIMMARGWRTSGRKPVHKACPSSSSSR